MKREQVFLSTIAPDAGVLALRYGVGLEIAEFCTASNIDHGFSAADSRVQDLLRGVSGRILHGPFNELHPCAVDLKARELAAERYNQAILLARRYNAKKIVLHGGYIPRVYYPCWYVEQSVCFWKDFIKNVPEDLTICLENVLEDSPNLLGEIVGQVNDSRLKLCLDVGHVNAYSDISVLRWIDTCGNAISHFHIHNNDGSADTHSSLPEGTLPMADLLDYVEKKCPMATVTLEIPEIKNDVPWLIANGFLEEIQ